MYKRIIMMVCIFSALGCRKESADLGHVSERADPADNKIPEPAFPARMLALKKFPERGLSESWTPLEWRNNVGVPDGERRLINGNFLYEYSSNSSNDHLLGEKVVTALEVIFRNDKMIDFNWRISTFKKFEYPNQ